MATTEMKENRIFRFDFSGDEPKILPMPEDKGKATKKKTISPELRQKIKEGQEKQKKRTEEVLTPREKKFCAEYIKDYNGAQAVLRAGYNVANSATASVYANGLLKTTKVKEEIHRLTQDSIDESNASAKEVMQFFTDVMRGKVKDQFGLEASLAERSKAANELAKRTIDIDQKIKANQNGDNVLTIKLDWQQS
mgnify:CR=1 FL=1